MALWQRIQLPMQEIQEMQVRSLGGEDPLEKERLPTPVLWPRAFHELYSPWGSPGKNNGVGCHSLLQGIFPTQGSNLHPLSLLH